MKRRQYNSDYNKWQSDETARKSELAKLQIDLSSAQKLSDSFHTVYNDVTKELEDRKQHEHQVSFPAGLKDKISVYDQEIQPLIASKEMVDMTEAEAKDQIERNNASSKKANENDAHTKARGEQNQAIKSLLIW